MARVAASESIESDHRKSNGNIPSGSERVRKRAPSSPSTEEEGGGTGGGAQKKRETYAKSHSKSRTGQNNGKKLKSSTRSVSLSIQSDKGDDSKGKLPLLKPKAPEKPPKRTLKDRIRFLLAMSSTLALIFSMSSLLFVFPLLIDPILLGMDAKFIPQPTQCRTLFTRNESGPINCDIPSCREGCTADLYTCHFVNVQYLRVPQSSEGSGASNLHTLRKNNDSNGDFEPIERFDDPFQDYVNATLFVNINGCGYPPTVLCEDFFAKYGEDDSVFPCFYSRVNESIVVPFYDRSQEVSDLIYYLSLPLGTMIGSGLVLLGLFRGDRIIKCRIVTSEDLALESVKVHPKPKSSPIKLKTSPGFQKRNSAYAYDDVEEFSEESPQPIVHPPKSNGHLASMMAPPN